MATVLYPAPVFGPIHSRRLGISLGINLMPADGKVCSFNCVYCECGLNEDRRPRERRPGRETVAEALEAKLRQMAAEGLRPDVLTFAGNGEPTGHPDFLGIIEDTLALRDRFAPEAKVSVLSNATYLGRPEVFRALQLVDNNIQKLDTVDGAYIATLDQPVVPYDVNEVVERLKAFGGHVIIQTMFLKGTVDGRSVDNTGAAFVGPWLEAVRVINPSLVMVYTIDRETPLRTLEKATREELDAIVAQVRAAGIEASASY